LEKEEMLALIPEENVLSDAEKAWISIRQLSAGFGTMLTEMRSLLGCSVRLPAGRRVGTTFWVPSRFVIEHLVRNPVTVQSLSGPRS
jgi:hypothetical protein